MLMENRAARQKFISQLALTLCKINQNVNQDTLSLIKNPPKITKINL